MKERAKSNPPFSFRLSQDLRLAMEQTAQAAGMTPAEWLCNLIQREVYGSGLTIEEGYVRGRSIGYAVYMGLVNEAFKHMPPTIEEGMAFLTNRSYTNPANPVSPAYQGPSSDEE